MPGSKNMSQNPADKPLLRQSLLARRTAMPEHERRARDVAISNRLTTWLSSQSPGVLAAYWPIRAEPDLRECYADWVAHGWQLSLPVVIDKNAPLKFLRYAPGDVLVRDAFGVMVPDAGAPQCRPDVILLPCVGFNMARYRIGYGGGFYDRTLAAMPNAQSVGIAYACLQAAFDVQAHDRQLDVIVTEDTLLE